MNDALSEKLITSMIEDGEQNQVFDLPYSMTMITLLPPCHAGVDLLSVNHQPLQS